MVFELLTCQEWQKLGTGTLEREIKSFGIHEPYINSLGKTKHLEIELGIFESFGKVRAWLSCLKNSSG